MKKALISITAVTVVLGLAPASQALTFLEGVGIGAGFYLIDQAIKDNSYQHRYVSPQDERNRGLKDGYNNARYDNPRNSRDYDDGYTDGKKRLASGWASPFQKN